MTSNYSGYSQDSLFRSEEVLKYMRSVSQDTLNKKKGSSDPICDVWLLAFHCGGDCFRIREIGFDYETRAFTWRRFYPGRFDQKQDWKSINLPTSGGYICSTEQLLSQFRSVSQITLQRKKSSGEPLYDGAKLAFHVGGENWLVGEVSIDYETGNLKWKPLRLPSF